MKISKLLSIVLAAVFAASCVGCGSTQPADTAASSAPASSAAEVSSQETAAPETAERPEKFSQDEYVLYQNIFYKDYGKDYDGTAVEKEGVFATIFDAYNDCRRYYVWGYYDQTRCCDWQWEFVPENADDLPPTGSLVTVTGTFVSDENALDKFRIEGAKIETLTAYSGPAADMDMRSMSDTLERVQMLNIISHADVFEGNGFTAYGRIKTPGLIEDPYYDGSWNVHMKWDGDLPAIGTLVEMTGTVRDGVLVVESMNEME